MQDMDTDVKEEGKMPRLMTRQECARFLRISVRGLDMLVHSPSEPLPCVKAGRRYLFDAEEVLEHLRRQRG